ncbi:hypothetical protein BCV72DRAFT_319471 [Rhizopus microsporus var. microsporus]|uniref:Uncharacterized protein n=1 Tax=Rhizopus microsporus var. microsporus TaxID=86635 RepID=A0A1X0QQH7_RHIZD|nr:hypothetical protein BCV72DRAFT_319471 [Rhizopus microsporus var. microsporus]
MYNIFFDCLLMLLRLSIMCTFALIFFDCCYFMIVSFAFCVLDSIEHNSIVTSSYFVPVNKSIFRPIASSPFKVCIR